MKFELLVSLPFIPVYDTYGTPSTGVTVTENDPFIPEQWANESIAILIENMVAANLVHRDFENMIAQFGDVINTRKPSEFVAYRKNDYEDVTIQTPEATNVQVKLDQHFHVSFLIKDGEDSMAFKDLVSEYLEPAIIAIAQAVDKIVLGQHAQWLLSNTYSAGYLGLLGSSTAKDYILDTRKVLNDNKCPATGRRFIVSSGAETSILKADDFTSAEKVGDEGSALREASLGHKLGFEFYMCQSMSDYTNSDQGTVDDDAVNLGAGYAAGSTSIVLNDSQYVGLGDILVFGATTGFDGGDLTPQLVTANNGTTETVTITPGLKRAITDAADMKIFQAGKINQGTSTLAAGATTTTDGYRAGWHKGIVLDNLSTTPGVAVGMQLRIATGASGATVVTAGDIYTIIAIDSTGSSTATVRLDRPLDTAVVDNAIVSFFPTGNYNFAFHRNAVALVTRPLALPRTGTGALAAVVNYDGIGLRVVITYDGVRQGHLVTVDLLCGVKVLDKAYGAVMYG
jgi:hypothetical protein